MSDTTTSIVATSTDKEMEKKMDEMKMKVDNLFNHAREFIANSVSKDDIKSTIRLIGAGLQHLLQTGYYLGVAFIGLVLEYIKKFVAWLRNKSVAAAKYADEHLHKVIDK